jgi:SAM-dependent methyltransferase
MSSDADAHRDQIAYWNGMGGQKWIAAQDHTDVMLEPVSEVLFAKAQVAPGTSVLDIGCGCGATAVALSRAVGPTGRVLAVDVSEPMLARARARLADYPQSDAVCADASVYPFSPFADLAFSRFGVMFFGDPALAFSNIRRALRANGRLIFACWRPFDENPWMKIPLGAAYSAGVPPMPPPAPEEPGPFSFADPERVRRILMTAGFREPAFSPVDLTLDIAAGKGLDAAIVQSVTIGAASRALRDQPEETIDKVKSALGGVLRPYVKGERVEMAAAIWLVESVPA